MRMDRVMHKSVKDYDFPRKHRETKHVRRAGCKRNSQEERACDQ